MNKQQSGRRGGKATLRNLGREHFRKIGQIGGMITRQKILSSFTIEDLENPITAQTVREKLEQLDAKQNES